MTGWPVVIICFTCGVVIVTNLVIMCHVMTICNQGKKS
ncbi:hypothetical protein LCGC14_0329910 [marine sediment metagenome]|uniref:Uncharacterized protein n=1 Tax=marine sediment metagenome TaxID=412755 RepID=A0A0F9WNY6_9ZZZZ